MSLLAVLFTSLLLLPLTSLAAPEISNRILLEKVHGPKDVSVIRAAGNKSETLGVGDALFEGDTIITAVGQIVELSAYDHSTWKIAPKTRLKLESRKPEKKTLFYWTFQLVAGSMWGEVPKVQGGGDSFRLKVKTKTAALGIRGTEYLLGGDEKLSTLDVLEGTVWWGKNAEFAEGTYKEVHAGEHAEMGLDGKIQVNKSTGDKSALAKQYGLVPEDNKTTSKPSATRDECMQKGKGWRSINGSSLGECFN